MDKDQINAIMDLVVSIKDLTEAVDNLAMSMDMSNIQFNYQDLPPHLRPQTE